MTDTKTSLSVLIAGPYKSGTNGDTEKIKANLLYLESFALPIFAAGHLPFIGEWLALPLINQALAKGEDNSEERYLYPVAHRLIARCDAILRVPGQSKGADQDVQLAKELGIPVYYSLEELLN